MKIAFLNIYNGMVERGSEVFVDNLAGCLSYKHEVCVFQNGEKKKDSYRVIQITGISYKPHQGFGIKRAIYDFWLMIFTIKCLRYLKDEKYDWVIPVNGRIQSLIIRIYRLFYKYRILISGHAGIGFDDWWNIKIGKPDIFVALSPDARNWAEKVDSKIKIKYIPNGIDIKKFNSGQKQNFPGLEKPVVLCVAALVPYKRVDLAIKAVAKNSKASMLIIGDGPLRDKIKALGEKLLGTRFKLIGKVEQERMAEFYRSSDIFTLPSRKTEAFGIVYLEAMACNLPVVAPNDENRKMIIGNAGLYCEVEDVSGYSDTIKKALEKDFGDEPINQAKKYVWDNIAKMYEKLIKDYQ